MLKLPLWIASDELFVGEGADVDEPVEVVDCAVWLALLPTSVPLRVAVIERPEGVGVPLVGPAVATAPIPPVTGPLSGTCDDVSGCQGGDESGLLTFCSLPPIAFAAATNAALVWSPLDGPFMVLFKVNSLILESSEIVTYPTIPAPQWPGDLQKK